MIRVAVSIALGALLTLASYSINNSGQCCDQILLYGWPAAFYGGSGGIASKAENNLIFSGLLFNILIWTIVSFFVLTGIAARLKLQTRHLIYIAVVAVFLIAIFIPLIFSNKPSTTIDVSPTPGTVTKTPMGKSISQDEKERINSWIGQNNLNRYGDPKDMVYAGGSPLFYEATGQTTDRYEYILKRHPNRPWNK